MNTNLRINFETIRSFDIEQGDAFIINQEGNLEVLRGHENTFNAANIHSTIIDYFTKLTPKIREEVNRVKAFQEKDYKGRPNEETHITLSELTRDLDVTSQTLSKIGEKCKEKEKQSQAAETFYTLSNVYHLHSRNLQNLDEIERCVKQIKVDAPKYSTWKKIKAWANPVFQSLAIAGFIATSISSSPLILLSFIPYLIALKANSLEAENDLRTTKCLYDLLSVPVIGEEQVKAIEEIAALNCDIEDFAKDALSRMRIVSNNADELFELLEIPSKGYGPIKNEFGEGALKAITGIIKKSNEYWTEKEFESLMAEEEFFLWIDDPKPLPIPPKPSFSSLNDKKGNPRKDLSENELMNLKRIKENTFKHRMEKYNEFTKWTAGFTGNTVEERCQYLLSHLPGKLADSILRKFYIGRRILREDPLISPAHYRRVIKAITANPTSKEIRVCSLNENGEHFFAGTGFKYEDWCFKRQ